MDPLDTTPSENDNKRVLMFKIVQRTRMNKGLPPFPNFDPGDDEWDYYYKWLQALNTP